MPKNHSSFSNRKDIFFLFLNKIILCKCLFFVRYHRNRKKKTEFFLPFYRVLFYYLYNIIVWSVAPQTTLWGRPWPRIEPGRPRGRDTTPRPPHLLITKITRRFFTAHEGHQCKKGIHFFTVNIYPLNFQNLGIKDPHMMKKNFGLRGSFFRPAIVSTYM